MMAPLIVKKSQRQIRGNGGRSDFFTLAMAHFRGLKTFVSCLASNHLSCSYVSIIYQINDDGYHTHHVCFAAECFGGAPLPPSVPPCERRPVEPGRLCPPHAIGLEFGVIFSRKRATIFPAQFTLWGLLWKDSDVYRSDPWLNPCWLLFFCLVKGYASGRLVYFPSR